MSAALNHSANLLLMLSAEIINVLFLHFMYIDNTNFCHMHCMLVQVQ